MRSSTLFIGVAILALAAGAFAANHNFDYFMFVQRYVPSPFELSAVLDSPSRPESYISCCRRLLQQQMARLCLHDLALQLGRRQYEIMVLSLEPYAFLPAISSAPTYNIFC